MRRNKQENDKIDNAIIQGLGEGKSIIQIAIEQRISQPTVYTRIKKMKERGVEIPKTSKIRKKQKKQENDEIDDAIIQGLREGKTQSQIAIEQGTTQPAVYYRIKKMKERGLEIPKTSKIRKKQKKQENDEIDDAIIQGLREGKAQSQIAIEQGTTQPAVYYRIKKMKERGVEIPKRQKKQENDKIDNAIIQGLGEGKSIIQIVIEQGISQPTVYRRIKKMKERGVEIPKTPRKRKKQKKQENDKIDNAIIQALGKGKTQSQVAREQGISRQAVSYRIKKMEESQGIGDGKLQVQTEVKPEIMNERIQQKYEEAILYIIQLKHATKDQIIKLAKYYGIDANSFFKKYKAQIRFFNGDYR